MGEMIVGALILLFGQTTGFALAVSIANSRRKAD